MVSIIHMVKLPTTIVIIDNSELYRYFYDIIYIVCAGDTMPNEATMKMIFVLADEGTPDGR